jgi:endonuclease YncB( thermonuclease family)
VHRWENEETQRNKNSHYFSVKKVLSGNEIELLDGRIMQYIGIRVPGAGEAFFEESRDANARLLQRGGSRVLLVDCSPQEREGYYRAYVFCPVHINEDKVCCFVNIELLLFGYAVVEAEASNHKYKAKFLDAQNKAQQTNRGLWASQQKSP